MASPVPWLLFLSASALLLGAGLPQGASGKASSPDPAIYEKQIRPVLQQFCMGCHSGATPSGNLDLTAFRDLASVQRDPVTWRMVLSRLNRRSMPPKGMPRPTEEQYQSLITWLTPLLNTPDSVRPKGVMTPNPGRVLLHRLSRTEYNNTVRDLFGISSRPADTFPADGGGGAGFDNNADTLYIPPILMERYLDAADKILSEARSERLFIAHPGPGVGGREAARKILAYFAYHAFRRPVETAELARLMRLYDAAGRRGASFQNAVEVGLKAILISPYFLFRYEEDRHSAQPYPIDDYELASRLSYFLWSSMPDETLLQLAARKRLRAPGILEQQVRRMLASPKSSALADSFAGQWLRVRDLYTTAQPDPQKFPGYTPALRDAMYQEPIDLFASLLRENASLLRLIDCDYTYLNEDLAKLYGIKFIYGPQMRRVYLLDRRRGGVLTMAGVLTLTSFPQRTSPVLRGKWVLAQLLGEPVPPPPADAGGLPADDAPNKEGLTFRQRLEEHRKRPQCASCHSRMDPLGFGLENYDAIGRWREEIGGKSVDASGVLADGEKFQGPIALKQRLLEQKDTFIRNLTENMLAYALGRGLEPYDAPTVQKIVTAVAKNGYRSDSLILEIVTSYPFQYRVDPSRILAGPINDPPRKTHRPPDGKAL